MVKALKNCSLRRLTLQLVCWKKNANNSIKDFLDFIQCRGPMLFLNGRKPLMVRLPAMIMAGKGLVTSKPTASYINGVAKKRLLLWAPTRLFMMILHYLPAYGLVKIPYVL